MKLKVIVAHPGKQHSFQLANALEQYGMLHSYITTVYDRENSIVMKLIKCVISKRNQERANSRKSLYLPEEKVISICEVLGILLLAVLRLDKTKKRIFYVAFNNYVSKRFGILVAKYAIKNNADVVICYDTNAYSCFQYLIKHAPNIIRILDNAAVNRYGLFEAYKEMDKRYGVLQEGKESYKGYLVDKNKALYYKEEANLANYHIVATTFSAKMLQNIGIEKKKIWTVPYGVETAKIKRKEIYNRNEDNVLQVLYVGEVCLSKGIKQLIEAAEIMKGSARFHVVGGGINQLDTQLRKRFDKIVIYHGYLLQNELFKLFELYDVFLFPSLGDGFGFVVIEAMTAGLPVICSENSIGKDVVANMYNGFTIHAGSVEDIVEKVRYFATRREQIEKMGRNAAESVQNLTWENYAKKLNNCFVNMMDGELVE